MITEGGESSYRALAVIYLVLLDEDADAFLSEQVLSDYEPYDFPGEPVPQSPDPHGSPQNAPTVETIVLTLMVGNRVVDVQCPIFSFSVANSRRCFTLSGPWTDLTMWKVCFLFAYGTAFIE